MTKALKTIDYKTYVIHCYPFHFYIHDRKDNYLVSTDDLLKAFQLIDYFAADSTYIELEDMEEEDE